MFKKSLLVCAILPFIAACGGDTTSSTTTANFTAISIFSGDAPENAGVGRGTGSDGSEIYYIAPDIVNDVNGDGEVDLND